MEVDSNHRSNLQQIYSLSPLATRESIHTTKYFLAMKNCSIDSGVLQDFLSAELKNLFECTAFFFRDCYILPPLTEKIYML